MNNKLKGSLTLLIGTLIWGSTFVAQSAGMDYIGPFTFQAVRCGLAVLFLLPVIAIADKKNGRSFLCGWCDRKLWIAGLCCGIPLFGAINLQQVGLVYTTAGKAAFLTAMYIVLVPVLGIFLKRKPSPMVPVSVTLAVVGLYLLSCVGVTQINQGDLFMIGCALIFAVQILCVDHFAPHVDALRLNCIQTLVCTVISTVITIFTEQVETESILACWFPICYAGILSMGVAYSLQIIGQKHIEPTAASLIMSMESVFAVITAGLILKETMTLWETLGCVLMFIAVILSQIPIPHKKKALK